MGQVLPSRDRLLGAASILAGIGLIAATGAAAWFGAERLLREDAKASAVAWVDGVRRNAPDLDGLLDGRLLSSGSAAFLDRVVKVGDVFRFRRLDERGKVLAESGEAATPPTGSTRAADPSGWNALAALFPEPWRGATLPAHLTQALVPVVDEAGVRRGVFEVHVDSSGKRALFLTWLAGIGGGLVLLTALGLGLPAALRSRLRRRRDLKQRAVDVTFDRDALSVLPNRAKFLGSLSHALQVHAQEGRQLALHAIELDRFKEVNASLGHDVADAFLRDVAERLEKLVDRPEHLARLRSDEFAILQPQAGGARHAQIYAARIASALGGVYNVEGHDVLSGASIGIAVAPEHGTEAAQLVRSAGLALDRARSAGANGIRVYSSDLEKVPQRRLELQGDLRQAIENQWFALHYQPQYDLHARRLVGFEALLRLVHPERGVVPPAEFIPVAEETGMMGAIGEWALREACRVGSLWPEHLRLAVNLSPAQFRTGDLAKSLRSILDGTGMPGRRMEVEIAEGLLADPSGSTEEQILRLKEAGISVVLDLYGTGASSLNLLRRPELDAIKIDRSLVGRLGSDDDAEKPLQAILNVAATFGLRVVAVGVETAEQARFLLARSCHVMQGFLLGHPVPATEVAAIILKDARSRDGGVGSARAHEARSAAAG